MPADKFFFKRTEKKYLLDSEFYAKFIERIGPFTRKDAYGEYTIANIYFDTPDHELIRRSLEKPTYKEKLRLRSYGTPGTDDKVFLEIKKKYKGTVCKRRVVMSLLEAQEYLRMGVLPPVSGHSFDEIDFFLHRYDLSPAIYLAYDREAWDGITESDLRITSDRNIRYRSSRLTLADATGCTPLLGEGQYIVEIKTSSAYPLWLTSILSDMKIYPVSFSKYGRAYSQQLKEKNKRNEGKIICLQAS